MTIKPINSAQYYAVLLVAFTLSFVSTAHAAYIEDPVIVPADAIEWSPLNPARGDQSPRAGALWGDRTRSGPSGFLVKFQQGFASPAHIHNVTYRGIVISGLLHNDDPNAARMWMPEGSFWTQPAGEGHVTAASAHDNIAYIEIDRGPYLVQPLAEAFDTGERPVNVDAENIVWLDLQSTSAYPGAVSDAEAHNTQIAFLWGQPSTGDDTGALLNIPSDHNQLIAAQEDQVRLVSVTGELEVELDNFMDAQTLQPGSYIGLPQGHTVTLTCKSTPNCTVYARTSQLFEAAPTTRD